MTSVRPVEILLTHAYRLADDPAEGRIMRPYAPLGVLSLAAYLEREGRSVVVYDPTFDPPERFAALCTELRPPLVGISVNLMTRGSAVQMIAAARTAGARVIVGGPEPASYPEEFLAAGAEVVVIGEGEMTLSELVERCAGTDPQLEQVQGIVWLDRGTLRRNPARPHIEDLDSLPLPARGMVDLHRYLSVWRSRHGHAALSVSTMRGCPYTCTWCSHAVYGRSYRRRSPGPVAEELQSLLSSYAPDLFWFADDVFTINITWLRGFRQELVARDLRIAYECISRADRLDEESVTLLRETGCRRLWIGTESGSQRILDRMSRGVSVEQVATATRLARAAGIEVGFFLMFGYDGETREDVEATIRHVRRCKPDVVLTTLAYPIKGTAYYRSMEGRMQIPLLPFAEWNDREIRVKRHLPDRFYWFAHRRVINEAAFARMDGAGRLSPGRRLSAFLKAKTAQLGMILTRQSHG